MAQLNTISGFFFDTTNTITCDVSDATLHEALLLCSSYERQLSRFVQEIDIWRINHAKGAWVEVGDNTIALLACAEQVRLASQGAFNVALGSVMKLWDFSGGRAVVPSDEKLKRAQKLMESAVVTLEENQVHVPAGVILDLGGIAKGYICDCVTASLREAGATSGILNFGGNVVTIGEHPEGRPWQAGLQTPTAERDAGFFAVVESTDTAVVTSGVYERAFVLDGQLYHHIIDPRTCYPVTPGLTSAAVVAENGMLADALATALLILDAKARSAFLEHFGVQGVTLDIASNLHYSKELPLKLVAS